MIYITLFSRSGGGSGSLRIAEDTVSDPFVFSFLFSDRQRPDN